MIKIKNHAAGAASRRRLVNSTIASIALAATMIVGSNITAAQARELHTPHPAYAQTTLKISPPARTVGWVESFRTVHLKTVKLGGGFSGTPVIANKQDVVVVQWKTRSATTGAFYNVGCTEYHRAVYSVESKGSLTDARLNSMIDITGQRSIDVESSRYGNDTLTNTTHVDSYDAATNTLISRLDFRDSRCPATTTDMVDANGRMLKGGWSWGGAILLDVAVGAAFSIALALAGTLVPGINAFAVAPATMWYYYAVTNCVGAGMATVISGRVTHAVTGKIDGGSFVLGCVAGVLAGSIPEVSKGVTTVVKFMRGKLIDMAAFLAGKARAVMVQILAGSTTRMISAGTMTELVRTAAASFPTSVPPGVPIVLVPVP